MIACAFAQPGGSDPQPSDTITREAIAAHNADFAIDVIRDLRPGWVRGLTRDAPPTRERRCLITFINGQRVGVPLPRSTSRGDTFTPVEDKPMGSILSKDVTRIEYFEPGDFQPDGFPSDRCYAIHFTTR